MAEAGGILYSASIEGDGSGRPLSVAEISDYIRADSLAWIHLDALDPTARHWLETELSYLDPLIVDALLAEETRPRLVEVEDGALMILRGVNLNADAQPEDMVSLRLWIDSHRIISVQRRPLKAVTDIQERLAAGRGPKHAGEFIALLTSRLFERMEPVMTDLGEVLDDIEERVMDHPEISERQDIIALRRQAIIFRRYFAPQRDIVAQLHLAEFTWLDATVRRRLQENHDRITRYVEDIDAIRERAQIVKDELANALADRMNRNLYMLSLVAAIFLPLGFLTGLLGINVGGIPGAEGEYAFWVFAGMLTALVAAEIALFRWMKWL